MKRAYRRRYHYIYKTTCIITGKYYLGMHSTDNLNDGYIGSGKRLWYSINKHGAENHVCEVQEHYFTREWLREREAELVCAETLTDPMCMNLKTGGEGGWDHITTEAKVKGAIAANKIRTERSLEARKDPEHVARRQERYNATMIERYGRLGTGNGMVNHSDETKARISATKKANPANGEKNSQFGSMWIHHLVEKRSIKIKSEEMQVWADSGWVAGRKMKF